MLQEEELMVDSPALSRQRPLPESPVSPEEVASVRRPTLQASMLPPRTFHDQDVFDYEQDAWFAGGWVSVGRVEDAQIAGQYFLAPVASENLIIVRGNDGELRGFYNVCRHRGATILGIGVRHAAAVPVPVPRLGLRPGRDAEAAAAHGAPGRFRPGRMGSHSRMRRYLARNRLRRSFGNGGTAARLPGRHRRDVRTV